MSKLETLKFFLWKRSGLHLRDALARYYEYLSNEEIRLYEKEMLSSLRSKGSPQSVTRLLPSLKNSPRRK